jgi:hypothetical protein
LAHSRLTLDLPFPASVICMSARLVHFRRIGLVAVFAAGLACALPGCCCCNLWGEGFPREVQEMTEGVRPREPNNERWGMSTKSREIERNLGVGD